MTETTIYSHGVCTYGSDGECDCAQPQSIGPLTPTDDAVTVAYNVLRYAWDNSRHRDPPSRADVREALRQAFIQQAHEGAENE